MEKASIEVVLKTGAFARLDADNFDELRKGEEPHKVKYWARRLREAIGLQAQKENIQASKKEAKVAEVGAARAELEEIEEQAASTDSKAGKKEIKRRIFKAEKNLARASKGE